MPTTSAGRKLPNIIYMHSHDTGRHVSAYGVAVDTPNMQRFAEQGVVFRQAFCAGPTCSPSRAALCTGMYPHQNGMMGLRHRGFSLHDLRQTWYTTWRDAGYHAVLGGLEHVGLRARAAEGLGHETDLAPRSSRGQDVMTGVVEFLGQKHTRPFFLDVGVFETHRTGKAGSPVQWHNGEESPVGDPRYVRTPPTLPDTPETRLDIADFHASVTRLDACYGRVLDALEKSGLAGDTLVIITTDHGIAFPGMKCSLTDHGMGVLLMMRGPAGMGLDGGKVIDAMVSHLDLYPTLCDLLGLPTPGHCEGKSLRPLLDGSADPAAPDALHDAVFSEVTYHAAYEPKRAVRTTRHKYIRYFHDGAQTVAANIDDSVSKSLMVGTGLLTQPMQREQLYDLLLDPAESHNLATDPAHADTLADLRTRLDDWMTRTHDPLLAGPVPLPPGGQVNRHADASPSEQPITWEAFDPHHP